MRLLILPLLLIATGAALASVQPDPAADPMLAWLQAAGFPAWAVAIIWIGQRLIRQMQNFTDKLDRHVTQTERRLSRLEAVVFMGQERPVKPTMHCPQFRESSMTPLVTRSAATKNASSLL